MPFATLDTVVLLRDLPEHGLKRGDIGAVVMVYSAAHVEVEFVLPTGRTQALVILGTDDLRPVGAKDVLAVRQLDAA